MSSENYYKELNWIKQIAYNNNYNPDIVDIIISKIQYKIAINSVYPSSPNGKNNNKKVFYTLTYMGKITDKLTKFLKKYDLNFAFKNNKSLQIMIKKIINQKPQRIISQEFTVKNVDRKIVIVHILGRQVGNLK